MAPYGWSLSPHLLLLALDPAPPLALLDDATVAWGSDEVMSYPITNGGHVAFNYTLRHSAAHRWFYYPALRKDELLLFKAFGSAEGGERPFRVLFHTAFDLGRDAAGDAPPPPPRKSLEVRCIAVW